MGANRALIGGFNPSLPVANPNDRVFGSWRPLFNVNLFYKLGERWTLGVENDLFLGSGRAGEYLSFPFVTWEPGKHLFVQVGGGYYRFESRDQFTAFVHVNFVNPSTRKARGGPEEGPPASGGRSARWGRLSRWLGDG